MPSSTALLSVFHGFCWDTPADSAPFWEKLGNKSYSCLHVEAHGKILAHFILNRIQKNGKEGDAFRLMESGSPPSVSWCFQTDYSSDVKRFQGDENVSIISMQRKWTLVSISLQEPRIVCSGVPPKTLWILFFWRTPFLPPVGLLSVFSPFLYTQIKGFYPWSACLCLHLGPNKMFQNSWEDLDLMLRSRPWNQICVSHGDEGGQKVKSVQWPIVIKFQVFQRYLREWNLNFLLITWHLLWRRFQPVNVMFRHELACGNLKEG